MEGEDRHALENKREGKRRIREEGPADKEQTRENRGDKKRRIDS